MSRSRNALSVPTELPASGALPGSGTHVADVVQDRAPGRRRASCPPASSSSRPDVVCIVRTKSFICSSASAGGAMIDVDALAQHAQLGVGHHGGHLDERVGAEVEPGHLAVDPDDAVGALLAGRGGRGRRRAGHAGQPRGRRRRCGRRGRRVPVSVGACRTNLPSRHRAPRRSRARARPCSGRCCRVSCSSSLGLAVFFSVLDGVREKDDLWDLDEPVLDWLVAHRTAGWTAVLATITFVTGPMVLPIVVGVACLVWGLVRREWWRPMLLGGAMVASIAAQARGQGPGGTRAAARGDDVRPRRRDDLVVPVRAHPRDGDAPARRGLPRVQPPPLGGASSSRGVSRRSSARRSSRSAGCTSATTS